MIAILWAEPAADSSPSGPGKLYWGGGSPLPDTGHEEQGSFRCQGNARREGG